MPVYAGPKLGKPQREALERKAAELISSLTDDELMELCKVSDPSTGLDPTNDYNDFPAWIKKAGFFAPFFSDRPNGVHCFAERAKKAGLYRPDARGLDLELARVIRFAVEHAADLKRAGQTPASFAHTFAEGRRRGMVKTAADLIGQAVA
jgi:hypothetical protein